MTNGFPRWFRVLFVALMLTLCTVLVTQIIHHQRLTAEIDVLLGKIDSAQKRMTRQVNELTEYSADLPQVLAELAVTGPAAEAAVARVNELKAERAALRAAIAQQEAIIADLQAQLAALPVPAETEDQVEAALTTLTEVYAPVP